VSDQRDLALTAHDCLTLLAIMLRCADAMRHPEAEDDFLEFRRAADRMDHVAQQLISPHRAEMVTPEPIDLNRLIVECEGMLKRAVAPDVSLRLELGAVEGSSVRARRWDLERILLHLVVNAARGMVLGGVVVVETSSAHGVRPSVSITVSGSATAPTSSARIIPRSSTSSQDHSDLGLAAVARFVQRLNGVLQFESDSERRTRIQIDLPLASDSQDDPA
jgi:Signal transduction histidine kinase